MARTRERNFYQLIKKFTPSINTITVPKPNIHVLKKHGFLDEAHSVYKTLGGVLTDIPCRIGGWDFVVDGRVVELDEEAHFNRYRGTTFTSNIYKDNPYVDPQHYVQCCRIHEKECLEGRSFGGYWTNDSAEKQFGKAGPNRDLTGNGSPRWKQRAFYDFVKDFVPLVFGVPLIRIPIYEVLTDEKGSSLTVDQILQAVDTRHADLLYHRIIRE